MALTSQTCFVFPQRGGRRKGAGRKAKGGKAGVSHRARAELTGREPLHVTLRVRADVCSLRSKRAYRALRNAIELGAQRDGFRQQHYSILGNHMHLIVEADDRVALSRGMMGLKIRIAKRINRLMGRRGAVFSDRYHANVLKTPRQARNALLYVLNNARHHAGQYGPSLGPVGVDPLSSAITFIGWSRAVLPPSSSEFLPPLLPPPKTWLLRGDGAKAAASWIRPPVPVGRGRAPRRRAVAHLAQADYLSGQNAIWFSDL